MDANEAATKAKEIIISGFEHEQDEDAIKVAMVNSGIPFGKVNALFKKIAIAEGLILDPVIIRENLDEAVAETQWDSFTEWNEFDACIQATADDVEGATYAMALRAAKKFCEAEEIAIPKKVAKQKASKTRGSKVDIILANIFNENKQATRQDCYNALLGNVKASKNAVYYVKANYVLCYAIANGITLIEAITQTADQTITEVPDEETYE
jgi:hypothetical protein